MKVIKDFIKKHPSAIVGIIGLILICIGICAKAGIFTGLIAIGILTLIVVAILEYN